MSSERLSVLAAVTLAPLALGAPAAAEPISCEAESFFACSLATGACAPAEGEEDDGPLDDARRILRFVQLSDVHVYDDDGSPVFNGSQLEPALEPTIANGSAQRLQDEYTDEVLNAMIATINACHEEDPIELMIATGDNTDTMTLNETRRFIDNLDGVRAGDTAYEASCGYLTRDSNENPRAGLPCPPEVQDSVALQIATGKLVADSQSNAPDPEDPVDQFMPTRSPRQNVDTALSSATEGSLVIAPGLPEVLRCDEGDAACSNHALDVPYYAVFGNHDGAVRGTVTMQRPFQAGTLAFGRYFFQSQREWINEFFFTTTEPGPVGHGFAAAGTRLQDPDDRNDGYYAFDAGAGRKVRIIVLNTLYDGVRNELHRNGQTNADTQGLVAGNEATNPIGLEQGVMDEAQFQWLESELAAADAAGQVVLVFSHHPDRSFTERRLGFAADGGKTADELDELLSTHGNVLAHVAGHTHENIIRPCRTGAGNCPIGGSGGEPDAIANPFWRVETASLIDYPQEGRIVEVYELPGGGHALKLTMIRPDPNDATANLSRRLAIAEATCNVSQMLGGSLSSGPYDQGRLETVVTNAGEAAVQQKFCFGEASLSLAEGGPDDRDVILLP